MIDIVDFSEEFHSRIKEAMEGQDNYEMEMESLNEMGFPKNRKFTLIDIETVENGWEHDIYNAVLSASFCHERYMESLKKERLPKTDYELQQIVSKLILYCFIEDIVSTKNLGGETAYLTFYVYSSIAYLAKDLFDLDDIWRQQVIPEQVFEKVEELIPLVWLHLSEGFWGDDPSDFGLIGAALFPNWSDLASKLDEWEHYDERFIVKDPLQVEPKFSEPAPSKRSSTAKNPSMNKISANSWLGLSKWAKQHNFLEPNERNAAYNFGKRIQRKEKLTDKQEKLATAIYNKVIAMGYNF